MNHKNFRNFLVLVVVALFCLSPLAAAKEDSAKKPVRFEDVQVQTGEFIGYYNSIRLTADQEKIKNDALSKIPAPCCSEFSQATCCCPCNMAKSIWGLSHFLIAKHNYKADQVRETVLEWTKFINPDGFDGNVCK